MPTGTTPKTTTQECQCSLPPEISWAGPAAQLCPHSELAPALEIQSNLIKLLDDFMQEIPVEDLLNKPLLELAEKYMRDVLGGDFNLMNEREHNVLMIGFLRHVGIAVMTLMSSMVANRARQEAQEPARKQSPATLRNQPDPIFDEINETGERKESEDETDKKKVDQVEEEHEQSDRSEASPQPEDEAQPGDGAGPGDGTGPEVDTQDKPAGEPFPESSQEESSQEEPSGEDARNGNVNQPDGRTGTG